MGFFDKVRTFVGDHGCKVEVTSLERQPTAAVKFPIGDSVFKGQFRVLASKPCTILAHKVAVVMLKKHPDGREEQVVLSETSYDEKNQVIGSSFKYPYEMKPGDVQEDGFCTTDIDIPGSLRKVGYADAKAGANAKDLSFFVKVSADVKGTPMDAEAKIPFSVVA